MKWDFSIRLAFSHILIPALNAGRFERCTLKHIFQILWHGFYQMVGVMTLSLNLGSVTSWQIEYSGNDAMPISGSDFIKLTVSIFPSFRMIAYRTWLSHSKEAKEASSSLQGGPVGEKQAHIPGYASMPCWKKILQVPVETTLFEVWWVRNKLSQSSPTLFVSK